MNYAQSVVKCQPIVFLNLVLGDNKKVKELFKQAINMASVDVFVFLNQLDEKPETIEKVTKLISDE